MRGHRSHPGSFPVGSRRSRREEKRGRQETNRDDNWDVRFKKLGNTPLMFPEIRSTAMMANIPLDKTEIKESANTEIDIERTATSGTGHHGISKDISVAPTAGYHRSLTRRKVMMMNFGAGIGTGLWVGTGQALHYGMNSLSNRLI